MLTEQRGGAYMAQRNEAIAMADANSNKSVLDKLKDRLRYKLQRLEILKIEIKQLRELVEELEK
jgi:hypothetical protein